VHVTEFKNDILPVNALKGRDKKERKGLRKGKEKKRKETRSATGLGLLFVRFRLG